MSNKQDVDNDSEFLDNYEDIEMDTDVFEELNCNDTRLDSSDKLNNIHAYLPKDDLKYNQGKLFRIIIGKKSNRYNRTKNIGISKNVMDIFAYSFNDNLLLKNHKENALKDLSNVTYETLSRIDNKKYPIEALYKAKEEDYKDIVLSDEAAKKEGLPTSLQNLALMKQPIPEKISEKYYDENIRWVAPRVLAANNQFQRFEDLEVFKYSYDGAVIPIVVTVLTTDNLIKNKIVKVYRAMFEAEFEDTEVYVEESDKVARVSLPVRCDNYIDYVDDDVYRSIKNDTSKRNTSERKHGKNIEQTFGRSTNRNDLLANV